MSIASKRLSLLLSLIVLGSSLLSACADSNANDLLAEIKSRGTIRVSTDVNYAPQSQQIPGAARATDTKCGPDELTANQMEGFDIDTALEIARRLGVEACFVSPPWETITGGNWGGQWDISVGSMTITKLRQTDLWFTPGYYFAPAQFAIRTGTNLKSIDDLAGKSVCVGTTTTYDDYLNGRDVGIPDSDIRVPPPQNVKVIPMATDADCVQAIQAGPTDFDAFLTSSTVVETSIAQGAPIEKLGAPVFVENLAVALDKHSPKDSRRLLDTISQLVGDMHADGTLKASSMKWFGLDRTVSP